MSNEKKYEFPDNFPLNVWKMIKDWMLPEKDYNKEEKIEDNHIKWIITSIKWKATQT